MAKFKKPHGPRKRLTFYLTDAQAKRLSTLQAEAAMCGRKVSFADDFSTWINHQLTQGEKGMKALKKELAPATQQKGGPNG